jgi:adenosylcobinamide-GDP ribazoletransferase
MNRLLAAIRFLTIVPLPGSRGMAADDLARSTVFFPLVGLAIGAAAAGLAWAITPAAPPLVRAAILVLFLTAVSGGLHIDGLSDTADGFLSARPRERILEIMKDSHVGAMGVVAIVGVVLLKFAALASLQPRLFLPTVLLMPLAGRTAIVVHMAILPSARPGGLADLFLHRGRLAGAAILGVVVLAAAAWAVLRWRGLAVGGISMAVAIVLAGYVRRKIGGATGDTLGAACELVEIVPALTLALWPISAAR